MSLPRGSCGRGRPAVESYTQPIVSSKKSGSNSVVVGGCRASVWSVGLVGGWENGRFGTRATWTLPRRCKWQMGPSLAIPATPSTRFTALVALNAKNPLFKWQERIMLRSFASCGIAFPRQQKPPAGAMPNLVRRVSCSLEDSTTILRLTSLDRVSSICNCCMQSLKFYLADGKVLAS